MNLGGEQENTGKHNNTWDMTLHGTWEYIRHGITNNMKHDMVSKRHDSTQDMVLHRT